MGVISLSASASCDPLTGWNRLRWTFMSLCSGCSELAEKSSEATLALSFKSEMALLCKWLKIHYSSAIHDFHEPQGPSRVSAVCRVLCSSRGTGSIRDCHVLFLPSRSLMSHIQGVVEMAQSLPRASPGLHEAAGVEALLKPRCSSTTPNPAPGRKEQQVTTSHWHPFGRSLK